jgi:pilus assembly protein CpaE
MQLKKILILASAEEDLHRIEDQLRDERGWQLTLLRVGQALNGTLRRALSDIDLAVVCCRGGQVSLLEAIDALPAISRPQILVCGDLSSPETTRLLVRIGVVDLLPSTPTTPELQSAIRRAIQGHATSSKADAKGRIISVFGVSGGVGASLIAGTLAHLVALTSKKTLLIDLDLIYAPLAAMFGLKPVRGIVEAIQQVDTLDMTALDGYVTRHESGLALLSSRSTGAIPVIPDGSAFNQLLALCQQRYEFIFVSANHRLDPLSIEAAGASNDVLLVLEQHLSDVRLAARLRQLLIQGVGVPESIVRPILNKYSTRSPVKDNMISKAIGAAPFGKIPEDGPLVRRSLDSGMPLAILDRHSPVVDALVDLEAQLTGLSPAPPVSAVRRIFATLSRGVQ